MSWAPPPGEPVLAPYDSPGHPMGPWFETWRRERRLRSAARPPRAAPGRRAAVTIVHNEPVFLPLWLRYYGQFFGAEDLYVLDHETSDGSTAGPGFQRIPVEHPAVDHTWMARTLEELQHDLLRSSYELVLVTDVDEIVAPVPKRGTLGDYLDAFDDEWVNCLGYELLHMPDREPALDVERPILDQRGWWFVNDGYDKAALATAPMGFRPGLHGRADFQFRPDPDLRLIHLHRMDYDLCLERHRTRSRRPWADEDERQGWAVHNRLVGDAAFDRWFFEETGFEGFPARPEPIGPAWRGVPL